MASTRLSASLATTNALALATTSFSLSRLAIWPTESPSLTCTTTSESPLPG